MQKAKKILLIEDEAELRKSIVEILELEGFEVAEAETGSEGIELFKSENPDVILCDILLPDIEGYEVLKAFLNTSKSKEIPFIFITALFDREHFRKGMELGADDYLVKPFTSEELLKSISTQWEKMQARFVNGDAYEEKDSIEHHELSDSEKDNVNKLVEEALSILETSNSIHDLIERIDKELKNTLLTKGQNKILEELKRQANLNVGSRKALTLFLMKFNLVHPHFIVDFKKEHQKLSSNEVFMAAATLMGLDTNQIADMMHISEASVRKNRYRLKKKLGLSKETDFYSYIQSFLQEE